MIDNNINNNEDNNPKYNNKNIDIKRKSPNIPFINNSSDKDLEEIYQIGIVKESRGEKNLKKLINKKFIREKELEDYNKSENFDEDNVDGNIIGNNKKYIYMKMEFS